MSFHRFFTAALLACAISASPGLAQRSVLARVLPKETLLFLSAPDVKSTLQQVQQMPLLAMWREEQLQSFLAPLLEKLKAGWQQGLEQARSSHADGQLPLDPDQLLKLRVSSFTVALTRMHFDLKSERANIGVLAYLDCGDTAALWKKTINDALQIAEQRSHGKLTRKETKVGDATLITVLPPEANRAHTDMSLNFAFRGTGMLFGTLQDEVEKTLGALAGDGALLVATDNYRNTAEHLDLDGAEVEVFLQFDKMLDMALDLLGQAAARQGGQIDMAGIERAVDKIGLRSIKAVGASCSYVGHKAVSKLYTYSPAPIRRGIMTGGQKTLDMDFLRWIPKDAVGFSAGTFDVAGLYNALLAGLRAYDADVADMAEMHLKKLEERMGVSLQEDLVGSLGHQYVSWSMPMSGNAIAGQGSFLSGAWLVQVKDPERLVKSLKALTQLTGGMVEMGENTRKDVKTYWLQLHLDNIGQGFDISKMFIPNFAFQSGYMVMGFSKADVRKALARLERGGESDAGNDIRSNPEFAAYREKLPKEGLESLSFTDWKTLFAGYYDLLYSFSFLLGQGLPVDAERLPEDAIFLNQHLFGAIGWSTSDANGFEYTSIGPFGPEIYAVVGMAAGAALFMSRQGAMAPIAAPRAGRGEASRKPVHSAPQSRKTSETDAPDQGGGRKGEHQEQGKQETQKVK